MIHGILNVYKEKGLHLSRCGSQAPQNYGAEENWPYRHPWTRMRRGCFRYVWERPQKVCDLLADKDKTYQAILLLGRTTDTQDTSGETLTESPVECSIKEIYETIQSFRGPYDQVPPMYSALKVNGKKAV